MDEADLMTVCMREASVVYVLKLHILFVCANMPTEKLIRVKRFTLLTDVFPRDPCRREGHAVHVLIQCDAERVQALDAGKRVVLDVLQFIRAELLALIPQLVIVPFADGLLVLDVQILAPFLNRALRENQRILQHQTVLEFDQNRIMRFCIKRPDRDSEIPEEKLPEEYVIVCKIVKVDDRPISRKAAADPVDTVHHLRRSASPKRDKIPVQRPDRDRPGDDVVFMDLCPISGSFDDLPYLRLLAGLRVAHNEAIVDSVFLSVNWALFEDDMIQKAEVELFVEL